MINVFLWCAVMINGNPTHIKGLLILTNVSICDRLKCSDGYRIKFGKDDYRNVSKTECLYKDPKEINGQD